MVGRASEDGRSLGSSGNHAARSADTAVASAGPSVGWRRHLRALALVAVGSALSAASFVVMRDRDRATRRAAFEQEATGVAADVKVALRDTLESVHALAALFETQPDVDEEQFSRFVMPALLRHPAIAHLEYAPVVAAGGRDAFERQVQQRHPGFQITVPDEAGRFVRAPAAASYLPLTYMQPFAPVVHGLDVGFDAERRRPIEAAVVAGAVTISGRIKLAEDAEGRHSFFASKPVYAHDAPLRSPEERRRAWKGLAIGIVRLAPVVEAAAPEFAAGTSRFVLIDDTTLDVTRQLLHESRPGAAEAVRAARGFVHEARFELADRRYRLAAVSAPDAREAGATAWGVLVLGLVVSAGAGAAATAMGRIRRLEAQVEASLQLGQYTLVRKLGEGGMGAVYEARHAMMRRPTAIKLLRSQTDESQLARFEREVRYTSQLTHPNTIQIHDYGRTPEGVFYYAMEYVRGLNLEDLVSADGPQPPARVVHVLEQAAGALAEAHAAGLVHRDIKPANIMLCVRGGVPDFVKVLDFGLVKDVEQRADKKLSSADGILGTPHYMAPETMTDVSNVAPAVDIYALGAVGYFLLTGSTVFQGESLMAVLTQAMTAEVVPPSARSLQPIGEGLERLLLECLSRDPGQRPGSADELLRRLEVVQVETGTWTRAEARAWWEGRGAEILARAAAQHRAADTMESQRSLAVDLERRRSGGR